MNKANIKIPILKIAIISSFLVLSIQMGLAVSLFYLLPDNLRLSITEKIGLRYRFENWWSTFNQRQNPTREIVRAPNFSDKPNPYIEGDYQPREYKETVTVGSTDELAKAVSRANRDGGNMKIVVLDGTYTLNDTLYIKSNNVAIVSLSKNPQSVIIQGGRFKNSGVGNILRISGSHFVLDGVTLQNCKLHLIQIAGEDNADYVVLRNSIFQDAYQQLVKVSYDLNKSPDISADWGLVEDSEFRYSEGVAPNYYTAAIDLHAGNGWVIRKNTIKDIASPSGSVAQYAVHIWNNSHNNQVIDNVFIDNDRSIGFGMAARAHPNLYYSNLGGEIVGNKITHADNGDRFADVGIGIEGSPKTIVRDNWIFHKHNYPNAIEYRFPTTFDVVVDFNVVNKKIKGRNGGQAIVENNKFVDD